MIHFPDELTRWPQWVNFNDKKIPLNPATGNYAKANDRATWGDFEQATTGVKRFSQAKGVGFCLTRAAGIVGIDFDDCVVKGVIQPKAKALIQWLDSYTTFSVSGRGLHCYVKGRIASALKVMTPFEGIGAIEVYQWDRYFAETGRVVPGLPLTVNVRHQQLNQLCKRLQSPNQREARQPVGKGHQAIKWAAKEVAQAKKGNRNNTLNNMTWWLRQLADRGQVDYNQIESAMLWAGQQAGLKDKQIWATIRSAMKGGGSVAGRHHRPPSDIPPPFPTDSDYLAEMILLETNGATFYDVTEHGRGWLDHDMAQRLASMEGPWPVKHPGSGKVIWLQNLHDLMLAMSA